MLDIFHVFSRSDAEKEVPRILDFVPLLTMATSDLHSPAQIPLAGRVISTVLSMLTIVVFAIAFSESYGFVLKTME